MTSMGESVAGGGGSGGDDGGSTLERLRMLIWNLSSYSNSRIVEIAKGLVEIGKESPNMAIGCQKTYVDCLEGSFQAGESQRCLALLYVCNTILSLVPRDESWQAVLSNAMSKYVPLIFALALRQQVCLSFSASIVLSR